MKYIIGLVAMLLPLLAGAQSPVKALHIGDSVPDITLTNVYNYPSSTIGLSDLKGKLVILDFWATWCGSCINAFPKMERLQKEFPDRLQVLLVNAASTKDDAQKVEALFKRKENSTGYRIELPYILKEKRLAAFFPYRYVPHYVWIDSNRAVIAITASEEVTGVNIREALKGNTAAFHMKEDAFDFDFNKPLFVNGNGGRDDAFRFRSIMSGYKEGLGVKRGSSVIDSNRIRIFMINTPVLSLIESAFHKEMDLPRNRVLYEGKRANALKASSGSDYTSSLLCYELIIPSTSAKYLAQYFREDIQRFLQLTVVRKKINSECLILTLKKTGNNTNRVKGSLDIRLDKKNLENYIHDAPASSVAAYINPFFNLPVIDETKNSEHVNISFDRLDDQQAIISSLEKAGFKVSEGKRELDFAVISDYPAIH